MGRGQVIFAVPERIAARCRSVSGVKVADPVGASSSHPHHYVRTVHGMEVTPWCPRGSALHRWFCHWFWFALWLRFTFWLWFTFCLWFWFSLWLWFWFSLWLRLWTRGCVWRRFCGLGQCLPGRSPSLGTKLSCKRPLEPLRQPLRLPGLWIARCRKGSLEPSPVEQALSKSSLHFLFCFSCSLAPARADT